MIAMEAVPLLTCIRRRGGVYAALLSHCSGGFKRFALAFWPGLGRKTLIFLKDHHYLCVI